MDQSECALCEATRPTGTLTSSRGLWPLHQLPRGPGHGVPPGSAGLGRPAHSQAIIALGAGRDQGELRWQKQGPPKPQSTLHLGRRPGYQRKGYHRGREPDGDSSRRAWPGALWVFPSRFLAWPVPRSHSQLIVGSARPVNHILWGPEVPLMLFLICGAITVIHYLFMRNT